LEKGRRVSVPGFGTFSANRRKARMGRNPATGKSIKIPAKQYPAVKAGKTLKERVAK
jgi:DNA-binding protein HU-beta